MNHFNKKHTPLGIALFFALFLPVLPVFMVEKCLAARAEVNFECLQYLYENASDSMTMGEAREVCGGRNHGGGYVERVEIEEGVVSERLEVDETNIRKPFTLMSHRSNYILLGTYNFQGIETNWIEESENTGDREADDFEVQFQLSIKTPLAIDLFDSGVDLFAAYSVNSHWQFYNRDMSSPFRETNHEPEAWLQIQPQEFELLGLTNTVNGIGINHMSNGQGGSLSRSWNRVYAFFGFERGNAAFMLRPWLRIQEDTEDDDNPDITDYYGHGELWMAYRLGDHTFSFMTRNNLESGFSKGALEFGWSFPLFDYPYLKGYLRYFSGYGESLIDYNRYTNQIGIGLQLTDIL